MSHEILWVQKIDPFSAALPTQHWVFGADVGNYLQFDAICCICRPVAYSSKTKEEAIHLAQRIGAKAAAEDVGVSLPSLYLWCRDAGVQPSRSKGGVGPAKADESTRHRSLDEFCKTLSKKRKIRWFHKSLVGWAHCDHRIQRSHQGDPSLLVTRTEYEKRVITLLPVVIRPPRWLLDGPKIDSMELKAALFALVDELHPPHIDAVHPPRDEKAVNAAKMALLKQIRSELDTTPRLFSEY